MGRYAEVTRKTGETDIVVKLDLDGSGVCDISTSVPFFDHMLNAFGRHGLFDLTVHAVGDVEVDAHHTVEDRTRPWWHRSHPSASARCVSCAQ